MRGADRICGYCHNCCARWPPGPAARRRGLRQGGTRGSQFMQITSRVPGRGGLAWSAAARPSLLHDVLLGHLMRWFIAVAVAAVIARIGIWVARAWLRRLRYGRRPLRLPLWLRLRWRLNPGPG